MSRTIMLFTNLDFGSSFIAGFKNTRDTCALRDDTWEVFASGKGRGLLRNIVHRAQWFKRFSFVPSVVGDVNGRKFAAHLSRAGARGDVYGIIAGFNQIFKAGTIARFTELVNIHPSLLPFYRGPAPTLGVLRHREHHTGFTLHRVTAEIDRGEVLCQSVVEIKDGDDAISVLHRIAQAAQPAFLDYLEHHVAKGIPVTKCTVDAANYYHDYVDYFRP